MMRNFYPELLKGTPHAAEADDLAARTFEFSELLVKKLGAILVSSASSGGRALSILPHVHVVVADANQVVPDLGSALALAKARHGDQMPSMLSFITGPSRTGDIERILVLGAHGPKELYLVLVG
jgi:L-lactate dehydrogenase complex protein LldG